MLSLFFKLLPFFLFCSSFCLLFIKKCCSFVAFQAFALVLNLNFNQMSRPLTKYNKNKLHNEKLVCFEAKKKERKKKNTHKFCLYLSQGQTFGLSIGLHKFDARASWNYATDDSKMRLSLVFNSLNTNVSLTNSLQSLQ